MIELVSVIVNTIASFVKVKISDFQTRFQNEYWLLDAFQTRFQNKYWLLAAPSESRRQRADYFFVHRTEADSQPTE